MSKVGIKLNLPGINEVMKSEGIQSKLKAAAEQVASIASAMSGGDAYTAGDPRTINWIAVINVYPDSPGAANDNFKNNTLLKAVQAAGLPLTKR